MSCDDSETMADLDPSALDRAFDVATGQVADGLAPWAVLGVADRDGVIRLKAIPGPGVEASRVAVDTVCLLASISKPIVATVVMQLVAEGRLSLVEPLTRVVPELGAIGEPPITAWHLLTHASGLGDLDAPGLLARGGGHAETVRALLDLPRLSAPGADFRYATATFDLLAVAITRIDGRPYPDALRARLLDPLGMADTTFDPRPYGDRVVTPLAPAFAGPDGRVPDAVVEAFIDLEMPGAGLWGTAPDLLRFGRAMLRRGELDGTRVLPAPFVDVMTRETTVGGLGGTGDPVTTDHYALGWGKPHVASPASSAAFGHGGITGTRLWIDPVHDLVVVYLTGVWEHPGERTDQVLNAIYAGVAG